MIWLALPQSQAPLIPHGGTKPFLYSNPRSLQLALKLTFETRAPKNGDIAINESDRCSSVFLEPFRRIVITVFVQAFLFVFVLQAQVLGATKPYPSMARLDQYLIPDREAEIAMARSAAPKSISSKADVMVLGAKGYTTAAKGTNGFLCIVERSWAKSTDDPEFWNPKVRAPNCFNAAAARTFVPIYLMKTKLVLARKSKARDCTGDRIGNA